MEAALRLRHGHLFVWDYGRFDGSEIDWAQHELLGLVEIAVWLGVLLSSQIFAPRLVSVAPKLAGLAVALQLISIGTEVAAGRNWDHATPTDLLT